MVMHLKCLTCRMLSINTSEILELCNSRLYNNSGLRSCNNTSGKEWEYPDEYYAVFTTAGC